jgi:hypothetical protein
LAERIRPTIRVVVQPMGRIELAESAQDLAHMRKVQCGGRRLIPARNRACASQAMQLILLAQLRPLIFVYFPISPAFNRQALHLAATYMVPDYDLNRQQCHNWQRGN